jgi:hypothetical protein
METLGEALGGLGGDGKDPGIESNGERKLTKIVYVS